MIQGHQRRVEVRAAVDGVIEGYERRVEVRAAVDGSDRMLPTSC